MKTLFYVTFPLLLIAFRTYGMPEGPIYFTHGLKSHFDMQHFIDSKSTVARETVCQEPYIPNRVVMGSPNGTLTIQECFEEFQKNRDQQALILSFPTPELLNRTLDEHLFKMNRPWVYIHIKIFNGPPPSKKTNYTTDNLLYFIRNFPEKIRWILAFTDDDVEFDDKEFEALNIPYVDKELQAVRDMMESFPEIRRVVHSVEFDAMHLSHTEYLLHKRVLPPSQGLLLRAPLTVLANTTRINFKQLIKICKKFGNRRMLYDVSESLRMKLLNDTVIVERGAGHRTSNLRGYFVSWVFALLFSIL